MLEKVQGFARCIFQGWAQSKVVEDANRDLRYREAMETNNKLLKQVKQWDVLRSQALLQQHRREEVEALPEDPGLDAKPVVPKTLFSAKGHEMTLD
eukprot:4126517-Lingulodinium_polyedra.AAC.1